MLEENVINPELAFIISQEKPDPRLAATAEIKTGLLQIMMALLCRIPSNVVLAFSSITGRFQDCNLPPIHGQTALKVCRSIRLLVCPTQNVSLSEAGAAAVATSMVKPSRRFAYEIVRSSPSWLTPTKSPDAIAVTEERAVKL
jgi:hypothetical protein